MDVKCPECGKDNPFDARYCEACSAVLALLKSKENETQSSESNSLKAKCFKCGTENTFKDKYDVLSCSSCGQSQTFNSASFVIEQIEQEYKTELEDKNPMSDYLYKIRANSCYSDIRGLITVMCWIFALITIVLGIAAFSQSSYDSSGTAIPAGIVLIILGPLSSWAAYSTSTLIYNIADSNLANGCLLADLLKKRKE